MSLTDKVYAFTSEKALFYAPCHVLLGVSGGADSMTLLHLLTHWPIEGLRVTALHIHHGLRGDAADRDAEFVRNYCAEHNVPFLMMAADVAAFADASGCSVEDAGRRVRYALFEETRSNIGANCILTAHTASDQVETMLMHLVRGCGLDGLAGIPASRGVIRRPLLCATREEVEEYCRQYCVPYVQDETNADTEYMRNFVRHRVIPTLRERNSAIERTLLRMREHMQADADYLNDMAQQALNEACCENGYDRSHFAQQPSVIRRRMIRMLFNTLPTPDYQEIHVVTAEQGVLRGGVRVSLPNGWVFSVNQNVVSLYSAGVSSMPESLDIDAFPSQVSFGVKTVRLELLDRADGLGENIHNLLVHSVIDYDRIKGKLCLRCRQEGDYMHPEGRGVGKTIKKLMNEWRIPAHIRDVYPILCDDEGVVLVPGYACDERVKVTDDSNHYLVCNL